MHTPKVSIITVVYDSKVYLEETMRHIFELKYPAKEVIVIDGGSTDGTREVIEQNSLHIDRWVSEPDNGIYDAMNKGLRMATGEYVWFINAGDRPYSPYVLENLLKGKDVLPDILYGETLVCSEDGRELGLRKKKPPKKLTPASLKKGMVVCHQSFIAKRELLEPFDTAYSHSADYDQMIKAVKAAETIEGTKEIVSAFALGGNTSKNRRAGWRERYGIMRKHFGKTETIISHMFITIAAPFKHYRKIK